MPAWFTTSPKENEPKCSTWKAKSAFRSVVEQLTEGLILLDQDGLIVEWNAAFEEMVGIPMASVIGRPAWEVQFEVLPPEKKTPERMKQIQRDIQAALNGEDIPAMHKPVRLEFTAKDGKTKVMEQTVFRIHSPHGYLIAAIIRDITEQHKAQQKNRIRTDEDGRAPPHRRPISSPKAP